jgi:hypothetical protein
LQGLNPERIGIARIQLRLAVIHHHERKNFVARFRELITSQEAALMKTREVTTATGETFTVPQGIQRLDSATTRGWQVRYHGTKYFADGSAGAAKALQGATKELLRRIADMPAPVGLRREPSPAKGSSLPAGISGPIVIGKEGLGSRSAVLSVSVPRFGKPNQTKKVHIGTDQTYTKTRFRQALAKAIEIRTESLALYEAAATQSKRKAATAMKKALHATRSGA